MVDVFVSYKKIDNSVDFSALPKSVLEHCGKYKTEDKKLQSLNAWVLLNGLLLKVTGKDISGYELSFSKRGKPFLNGVYISLSHSNGVVAVGCSTANFGLDVEVCKNVEKYKAVADKLGVSLNDDFFLKWTEIESATKLNDLFSTSNNLGVISKSKFVNIGEYKTAISVSSNNEFNIVNI